jgi:hypothetical protein
VCTALEPRDECKANVRACGALTPGFMPSLCPGNRCQANVRPDRCQAPNVRTPPRPPSGLMPLGPLSSLPGLGTVEGANPGSPRLRRSDLELDAAAPRQPGRSLAGQSLVLIESEERTSMSISGNLTSIAVKTLDQD